MLPKKQNFLLNLNVNNYSENTEKGYQRELSKIEKWLNKNNIEFQELDKMDIDQLKADMKDEDLAPRTINRALSILKTYLNYLSNMDQPTPISANQIKLLKTKKRTTKPPPIEEIKQLMKAPKRYERDPFIKHRNRTILETLFSTGCRVSELVAIDIEDIDDRQIQILGKGNKERIVYLSDQALKHLIRYQKHRPKDTEPLFVSKQGTRLTQRTIQNMIKEYREGLDLSDDITPHKIRHAFATHLAQQGADPAAIQHLLGHESLETTTKYINTSQSHAQNVHDQVFNNNN